MCMHTLKKNVWNITEWLCILLFVNPCGVCCSNRINLAFQDTHTDLTQIIHHIIPTKAIMVHSCSIDRDDSTYTKALMCVWLCVVAHSVTLKAFCWLMSHIRQVRPGLDRYDTSFRETTPPSFFVYLTCCPDKSLCCQLLTWVVGTHTYLQRWMQGNECKSSLKS